MWIPSILATLFFTQACGSIAYVQLNDRLPSKTSALEGKKSLFGCGGREKNERLCEQRGEERVRQLFRDHFLLREKRGLISPLKLGLYDAASLVKEAFRLRIENEGFEIVLEKKRVRWNWSSCSRSLLGLG